MKGFVEASLLTEFGGPELSVGEIGRLIQLMKKERCEEMVFAGSLKRPDQTFAACLAEDDFAAMCRIDCGVCGAA